MTTKRKDQEQNSRRNFLKTAVVAGIGFTIVPRYVLGQGFVAPSDKINLGIIGLGKQIQTLTTNFLAEEEAQIVAASDVWSTKREWYKILVQTQYAEQRGLEKYNGLQTYLDYEELVERSDIDAVIVATPDHWHGIQSINAMKAGKDLYCEKPLTQTIQEGIKLVKTAKKTGAIVQTGSMQRSWENFHRAVELVRNGYLGEIQKVLVNVGDPAMPYDMSEESTPSELDWNKWCGPAPLLGYNNRLAPSRNDVKFWPDWRLFKEVGGGILCDWGAHMFDIAQWALGMDHTGPVEYIPPKKPNAVRGLKMRYANGIEMVHEDFGRGWGVRFMGTEGTMDVSRNYLETTPKNILNAEPKSSDIQIEKPFKNHYADWLKAIKTRKQPICPAEIGHRSASICNIANIAYELRRPLRWNPEKEKFVKDIDANKLKKRKDRKYS